MMLQCISKSLIWIGVALAIWITPASADGVKPPNLVFILTDNQGAWTLGCYGNPDIRTPYIDRLANEGIRFTRALSCNPVCSPTRATFLTGLIPSQHGVHSFLDPKFMMGPEAYNALAEFTSLGEDLWTRSGVKFIEENRDRPFCLFLAYNGPYVLGGMMLKPARNRHAEFYRDHHFASFPVDTMHPWQFANKQFHNQQIAMERTACEVSGVDDGVGEIMATLKRLGLDESTLVAYAADQGWMGGQNGLWGMGDHTRPTGAHELMMQIPMIFRQPGAIPSAQTADMLVSNYDFLPTVLGQLGLGSKMPSQPKSPGRDYSPILRGESMVDTERAVFYEMETTRAIRTERWKYVARFPNGPYELYDMQVDPHERFNLYGQPHTEPVRTELAQELDGFFAEYADPQYDLWKGGRSKAKRHTRDEPTDK